MNVIVQKFGGSSLGTEDARTIAAKKVVAAVGDGHGVVVVVSAMGRSPSPYATDVLIDLMGSVPGDLNRELDLALSCGETVSAALFAVLLHRLGVLARAMTGWQAGIVTDCSYGEARIRKVRAERIQEELDEGRVVVVAGFQGGTEQGEITTLGRGGSDVTAAALGCALHAERIEIFTDVDGIMTADPRIVPAAAKVRRMTYREVCEMAHLGAGVIHPRAAEIAMEGGVPLWIKNTFSDDEGTLIADRARVVEGVPIPGDNVVTGIAHVGGLALVQVALDAGPDLSLDLLRALADAAISWGLINVSPGRMSFTIKESQADGASDLLSGFPVEASVQLGFAKISAVGAGMRGVPGVMAAIVEGFRRADVQIHQSADSHTSISCLVKAEDLPAAARALHEQFSLSS